MEMTFELEILKTGKINQKKNPSVKSIFKSLFSHFRIPKRHFPSNAVLPDNSPPPSPLGAGKGWPQPPGNVCGSLGGMCGASSADPSCTGHGKGYSAGPALDALLQFFPFLHRTWMGAPRGEVWVPF